MLIYYNILYMNIDNHSFWINLLPSTGRWLEKKWDSKENYQEQLGLDVGEVIQTCQEYFQNHGEVRLLDIGWNNAQAIQDIKAKLVEVWIPKEKIILQKADIDKVQEPWVDFLHGDLEDDDFLLKMIETFWYQKQTLIFLNQVSQYIGNRGKLIKFISEELLANGWVFHLNMIDSSFYSGNWIPVSMLMSSLHEVMKEESYGFDVHISKNEHLNGFYNYEIFKHKDDAELEFPSYVRVFHVRSVDGFKTTWYNFRDRIDNIKIKTILQTKLWIKTII